MIQFSNAAEFGALVRSERKRQGLTQTELAEFCGVGINFVSSVERGKETVELGKALALASMLGIDLLAERRGAWQSVSRYIELQGGDSSLLGR